MFDQYEDEAASPFAEIRAHLCEIVGLAVGLATFVGLHIFFVKTWERPFVWDHVDDAWWLNSSKSVLVTLVTLFLVTFVVLYGIPSAVKRHEKTPGGGSLAAVGGGERYLGQVFGAIAIWTGVLGGMVLVMGVRHSTDSLWPIVLAIGGAYTGVAVFGGMVAAVFLTAIFQARRSHKDQRGI